MKTVYFVIKHQQSFVAQNSSGWELSAIYPSTLKFSTFESAQEYVDAYMTNESGVTLAEVVKVTITEEVVKKPETKQLQDSPSKSVHVGQSEEELNKTLAEMLERLKTMQENIKNKSESTLRQIQSL